MGPERNDEGKLRGHGAAEAYEPGDRVTRGDAEPSAPQILAVQLAAAPQAARQPTRARPKAGTHPNNVRRLRQRAMMSKAELARRASVSPLTIDRVESGCPCRMDTKRKILEALGLRPAAAADVFPEIELG